MSPRKATVAASVTGNDRRPDEAVISLENASPLQTGHPQRNEGVIASFGAVASAAAVAKSLTGAAAGDALDSTLKVWDADTGRELLKIEEAGHTQVSFSPDGQWIATLV